MNSERIELRRIHLPADPAATGRLGEQLGQHLRPGDLLALCGEVGAGKTTLTQGLARGLRLDAPEEVASPTYLLVVEHVGPVRMLHADAYLPAKLQGFLADGGLDYLCAPDAVVVVEWADRIASLLPERTLWLDLAPATDGGRHVVLQSAAPEHFPWVRQLSSE
jgi:tRNA threonylcarbamoyladenosine biosynthesis protein TsaE